MKGLNHKLIVDTMQDGVFVSCNNVILYVNDAIVKMIGYKKSEIVGHAFLEFIHEDDRQFITDRHVQRVAGEDVPHEYEFRLAHKDGNTVYVLGNITVIDLDGRPAMTGTIKNITDRVLSELKIKEMEISYRTLLELCPDPIIVSDFEGKILMHNQAAYDVHESNSINFKLTDTNVTDYMATQQDVDNVEKMIPGISNFLKYNVEFKTQKGRIIPFELHTTTVFDTQGVPSCNLTIGRDISQIKEYETQLKQLISEKDLNIKEIHHRIKNNLQQVYSLLGLQMENEFLTKNYTQNILCPNDFVCFGIIHNVIEDARRRILAISIMHEMFYKHNTDCIEFALFLKELSNNIKNTYLISDKNIEVNITGDSFELCLDYIIPCGLIANEIIINAYKYAFEGMDSGTINIELHRSNGIREIIIADDGIGMFIHDVAASKTLGLSLVQGLVEQINGTFDIESEPGKGTKYKIVFADIKTRSKGIYGTR